VTADPFAFWPISQGFGVPLAAVTAVFAVILCMRLGGARIAGWMADRMGRRAPLMISIIWYSVCNFIAGFSPSFAFLFFWRAMLGIGMGTEWRAGAALAMESWPARSRGFIQASCKDHGSRLCAFFADLWLPLPALACVWIRVYVKEPEVWTENKKQQTALGAEVKVPLLAILSRPPVEHDHRLRLDGRQFLCLVFDPGAVWHLTPGRF
jgi:SHS family lactate transporter-like MFS transporter